MGLNDLLDRRAAQAAVTPVTSGVSRGVTSESQPECGCHTRHTSHTDVLARWDRFGGTPIARTHQAALVAQADFAGHAAANESPRALLSIEKAGIARLCLPQYGTDDAAISATIKDCEGCPAMREYLLALVPNCVPN